MKSKPRHTPETLQVEPLDMAKLNIAINEFFHEDGRHPVNIRYEARGTHAILRQPKLCLIDEEFVGHDISEKIVFYIYETETQPDGREVFDMLPTHEVIVTLAELEQFLQPPVTLAEFTKERRGYNARIRGNEVDWLRYLNKS